jgi:hypothetical protein
MSIPTTVQISIRRGAYVVTAGGYQPGTTITHTFPSQVQAVEYATGFAFARGTTVEVAR